VYSQIIKHYWAFALQLGLSLFVGLCRSFLKIAFLTCVFFPKNTWFFLSSRG